MKNKNMIEEIVRQMTLEEKASLCSGEDCWHSKEITRLNIPSFFCSDGPHGLRKQIDAQDNLGIGKNVPATCFPTASLSACSFDTELLTKMGEALGEECIAEGVNVLLGPGANMKRSPLCGRNFEYFGEDPLLSAQMACGWIQGVQSKGVGASLKHFAANNQEKRRMNISVVIDERTLRETYLRAYEKVVKQAKPWTVMCSYNKINGTYSSENKRLLTDILRDEWGYEGMTVSDWGAVHIRAEGLKAGLNLEMPGNNGINDKKIIEAVKSGKLDEKYVDEAAKRVVELAFRCQEREETTPHDYERQAHHKLAIQIAQESMVLLKNEADILPLTGKQQVAIVGDFAIDPRYQGAGSSKITPNQIDAPLDALRQSELEIHYYDQKKILRDQTNHALIQEEIVLVFAGLTEGYESEGIDRASMKLPEEQNILIGKLCKLNKKIIVVLMGGAPVELPWADDVDAILLAYLGGEGVGSAITNLLTGKVSPSGRLAESWPYKLEDNPSYENFPGDARNVVYREGIYTGYRYYATKKVPVRYSFGYGLSYARFSYSDFKVQETEVRYGEKIHVSFKVKNCGNMAAKHSILLFYTHQSKKVELPLYQLVAFTKVELQAGEKKEVTLSIDTNDMSYYDVGLHCFHAESGKYDIILGNPMVDVQECLKESITIQSDYEVRDGSLSVPERPESIVRVERPFGWDNCLEDTIHTKTGKIITWIVTKVVRWICRKEKNQEAMMLAGAKEMPFFSLYTSGAGAVSENTMNALIMLLNGKRLKALKGILKRK